MGKYIKKKTNAKNKKKSPKTLKANKNFVIKHSLFLISPLAFNKKNFFFYEIRKISFFKKYIKNWNEYKLNEDEIILLQKILFENRNVQNYNNKFLYYYYVSKKRYLLY